VDSFPSPTTPGGTLAARLRLLTALGGLLLFVAVLQHLGLFGRPPCPWWSLTATHCPACGGERAVQALSRGAWLEALRSNAAVVLALPLALIWLLEAYLQRRWLTPAVWGGLLLGLLLYTLLRNLPVFSAWAPG
jgi:hypothetical protein